MSGLCAAHCVALPVLAVSLPWFAAISHAEWVHKSLALSALALAGLTFWLTPSPRWMFGGLALFGVSLLAAGAFVEFLHAYETPFTLVGGFFLASAHALRWRRCKQTQTFSNGVST